MPATINPAAINPAAINPAAIGPAAPAADGLHILALNSGSSSLKFGLYRLRATSADIVLAGEAVAIGEAQGRLTLRDSTGAVSLTETVAIPSQRDAIARIGRALSDAKLPAPAAIGHRIVHGGPTLLRHCLIDDAVLRRLDAAIPFAPLHMPAALAVIRFARDHFPGVPQAACFDTAFHADMPELARTLPIPRDLRAAGVHRYGFHGLSCESILLQLGDRLRDRVVIAHLGNGASVTAVKAGRSVDTSMGLTPTGGVIMGTRSGDLDPGLLIYLMRNEHLDADGLETLVNHRSGLLGISGLAADMRRLHAESAANPDASLAIAMFCYSVRKQIAAMAAALDGIDLLVFTGGIGENDAEARAMICAGLSWTGVDLDPARNRSATNPVSGPGSRCAVMVLPSQEDEQIARHTSALLAEPGRASPRR
jgi:acetate kinase